MAQFLDLPPEIREMIFKLLVIPPTGCIEPVSGYEGYRRKFPGSRSRIGPPLYLTVNTLLEASDPLGRTRSTPMPELVSISFMRACRITYYEAQAMFWNSSTFIFSSLCVMRTVLKCMGKIAAGRIKSIRLFTFPWGGVHFAIKSMKMKLDTTSLRHLDIVLRREQVETIVKTGLVPYMGCPYLLFDILGIASKVKMSQRLIVPGTKTFDEADEEDTKDVIRRIESQWGERIVWGDTLPCDEVDKTAALP
jgi:hypothetical protein